MSYYKTQLEEWLETIDVKAEKVLDVGGGSNPVKGRTKSWEVLDYKILDNKTEEMVQRPDYIFDINKKEEIIPEKLKYDIIFCLEVFEYVWNPVQAMENLYKWLKAGGILYISFPFIYPHHSPDGRDYLRYTRWGVDKLFKEAGFRTSKVRPRTEINSDPTLLQWFLKEKMHPCRDYDGHNEIGYLCKCMKKL